MLDNLIDSIVKKYNMTSYFELEKNKLILQIGYGYKPRVVLINGNAQISYPLKEAMQEFNITEDFKQFKLEEGVRER